MSKKNSFTFRHTQKRQQTDEQNTRATSQNHKHDTTLLSTIGARTRHICINHRAQSQSRVLYLDPERVRRSHSVEICVCMLCVKSQRAAERDERLNENARAAEVDDECWLRHTACVHEDRRLVAVTMRGVNNKWRFWLSHQRPRTCDYIKNTQII